MTIDRFQSVVLRLGNQMFVRHYLWLNYPQNPQLMGVQFQGRQSSPERYKKPRSCECGTCPKCKHREAMRTKYRTTEPDGMSRVIAELQEMGFAWHEGLRTWTVERTEGGAK